MDHKRFVAGLKEAGKSCVLVVPPGGADGGSGEEFEGEKNASIMSSSTSVYLAIEESLINDSLFFCAPGMLSGRGREVEWERGGWVGVGGEQSLAITARVWQSQPESGNHSQSLAITARVWQSQLKD